MMRNILNILNVSQDTLDFVKYVVPYGANNRENEGDRFKRKGTNDPNLVDVLVNNVFHEVENEIGFRTIKNLKEIMLMADKTIKYGAGNCDGQIAIAFIFLLAIGIFNLRRIAFKDHVFMEFLDEHISSDTKIILDPWDDNAICKYSINEVRKQYSNPYTGVRYNALYYLDKSIDFNLIDLHDLRAIKYSVIDIEKLNDSIINNLNNYLVQEDNNIYIYSREDIMQFFKNFLINSINAALNLNDDEKNEASIKIESSQKKLFERNKNINAAKKIQLWYRSIRDENKILGMIQDKEHSLLAKGIINRKINKTQKK